MSAWTDYPAIAIHTRNAPAGEAQSCRDALDEIDRLRRWKAEAIEVLQRWDDVAVRFDLSGHLCEFTADAVGAEIDDLRRRLAEASPDATRRR